MPEINIFYYHCALLAPPVHKHDSGLISYLLFWIISKSKYLPSEEMLIFMNILFSTLLLAQAMT